MDLGAFRRQMKVGFYACDRCRCHELAIGIQNEQIARPVADNASARPVFVFVCPHHGAQGGLDSPVASPLRILSSQAYLQALEEPYVVEPAHIYRLKNRFSKGEFIGTSRHQSEQNPGLTNGLPADAFDRQATELVEAPNILEENGVIEAGNGTKPRKVIKEKVTRDQ